MVTDTELSPKAAAALTLIAHQRAGLGRAVALHRRDASPYGQQLYREANSNLGRVLSWKHDLDRNPEFFASLALGFMGRNGWGPLIDLIVTRADEMARA